jgi:DNA processing protein
MPAIAEDFGKRAVSILNEAGVTRFGVRVNGAGEYPKKLRDADHPVELLYYQGWWDLVESPCVAVVGTREPSDEGKRRAVKLTQCLVQDGFTVVSGPSVKNSTLPSHGYRVLSRFSEFRK